MQKDILYLSTYQGVFFALASSEVEHCENAIPELDDETHDRNEHNDRCYLDHEIHEAGDQTYHRCQELLDRGEVHRCGRRTDESGSYNRYSCADPHEFALCLFFHIPHESETRPCFSHIFGHDFKIGI